MAAHVSGVMCSPRVRCNAGALQRRFDDPLDEKIAGFEKAEPRQNRVSQCLARRGVKTIRSWEYCHIVFGFVRESPGIPPGLNSAYVSLIDIFPKEVSEISLVFG